MGRFTSLPVKPDTLDEVRARKRGGERYDDVVRRLLAATEEGEA